MYTPVWRERHCESKVSCPRTQQNVPGQGSTPDRSLRSRAAKERTCFASGAPTMRPSRPGSPGSCINVSVTKDLPLRVIIDHSLSCTSLWTIKIWKNFHISDWKFLITWVHTIIRLLHDWENCERLRVKLNHSANLELTINWLALSQSQWRNFLSRAIKGLIVADTISRFPPWLIRSMCLF